MSSNTVTSRADTSENLHDIRKPAQQSLGTLGWSMASEPMFITDEKGTLLEVNKAYCLEFGVTQAHCVGENFVLIIPEFQKKSLHRQLETFLKDGSNNMVLFFSIPKSLSSQSMYEIHCRKFINNKKNYAVGVIHDITPHIDAEKKLVDKSHELKAIFNAFPDKYFRLQANGLIIDYNIGKNTISYLNPDKVIGEKIQRIFPSDTNKIFSQAIKQLNKTQEMVTVEFNLPFPEDEHHFEGRLLPLFDKSIMVVVRDITDRIHTEATLKHIASLVATSQNAIISKTLQGIITSWNKGAETIYGYTPEEIVGRSVLDLIPDDRKEEFNKIMDMIGDGETVKPFETKRIKKGGSIIDVSLTISPIYDDHGMVTGASSIANDITRQKRIEQSLILSESRLRRVIESNIIGIIFWEIDGSIFEANDAFLKMMGYSRRDLRLGKINWLNMTPKEFMHVEKKAIKDLLLNGSTHPYEKDLIRKDSQRVPVIIGGALFESEKNRGVSFVLDVTQIKELEKQRELFFGIAGHELKTPLASMKALIQLYQHFPQKLTTQNAFALMEKFDDKIDTVIKLINDILDFTRIRSGKMVLQPEVINVNSLITETVKDIQSITKTHKIIIKGCADCEIIADKMRLTQVINNLITNAVKYSPQADRVEVIVKKIRNTVEICIKDFGVGIKQTEYKKVFEPFYQVINNEAKSHTSLGLGLFISSTIIKQHHGKLWVTSTPGKGSSFYFSLPVNS